MTWSPPIGRYEPLTSYTLRYRLSNYKREIVLSPRTPWFSINSLNFKGQLLVFNIYGNISDTKGQESKEQYFRAREYKFLLCSIHSPYVVQTTILAAVLVFQVFGYNCNFVSFQSMWWTFTFIWVERATDKFSWIPTSLHPRDKLYLGSGQPPKGQPDSYSGTHGYRKQLVL